MKPLFIWRQFLIGGLCLLTIAACSNVALSDIENTREDYNRALSNSEYQQMLLNIVRVHYGIIPSFIAINAITTQSTLTYGSENSKVNTDPGQIYNGNVISAAFWSVNPKLTFSQAPTITYTPMQTAEYMTDMISSIRATRIYLFLQAGWRISTVLTLVARQIGDYDITHYEHRSNESAQLHRQKFVQFTQLANLIENLEQANQIELSLTPVTPDKDGILIEVNSKSAAEKLAKILGFKQLEYNIVLSRFYDRKHKPENIVPLRTRSVLDIIKLLAYGVEEQNNHAPSLPPEIKSLLTVHRSKWEPRDNYFVKTKFNNAWYYIDSTDINSRNTLAILQLIYAIQLGDSLKPNLPLVTIPLH